MRTEVVFYLNGKRQAVAGEKAGWMLSDYLRYEKSLTGTKVVCAEGDCGACTILSRRSEIDRYVPINSCIATVAQMDGSSLVTVDALDLGPKMTPAQESLVRCHASQCGFCTPGFVMALTGLIEKKLEEKDPRPIDRQTAKNCFTGNLCRCTGYEPILDAATALDLKRCASVKERFADSRQSSDLKAARANAVRLHSPSFDFHAPLTLKDAAAYLRKNPDARLLAAGTDLGVVVNKRKLKLAKTLSLHLIPEVHALRVTRSRAHVGARVTLAELRRGLKDRLPEFARFLDLFASPQIKNSATLVGNVCNGSPIADTPPFLLAANAVLHLFGPRGARQVPIERFYLGYRATALKPGELVAAIEFDVPPARDELALYKVSQRKDLDISGVNAAFRARWNRKRTALEDVRIAYGGMAATPVRLFQAETALRGQELTPSVLALALQSLHAEMQPLSDLRGTAAFRRVVSENLFRRFVRERLGREVP